MSYLLDTHVFLWGLISPEKLSLKIKKQIISSAGNLNVSVISLWEIALKYSLGKLDLRGVKPDKLLYYAKKSGFKLVGVNSTVAASFYKLPLISDHKDPFDRMLVWQAINKRMTLISKDAGLAEYKKYGLKVVW